MARLEHLIADNMAALRRQRDMTQAELAARMRDIGLGWSTNRVTQLEKHHRPIGLLELAGVAGVLKVSVTDLLAGNEDVDLPAGKTPLEDVRAALAGGGSWHGVAADPATESRAGLEDLRKVAAKRGVEPFVIQAWAQFVFGRAFEEERDARLGDVSELPPRSLQTKRGHATRALLDELHTWWVDRFGVEPSDRLGMATVAPEAVMPMFEKAEWFRSVWWRTVQTWMREDPDFAEQVERRWKQDRTPGELQ